ncbi:hemerythrin domain-containing protein [Sphingopyxis sp.]|uniref:hemerythrin domain-containing protein n=1 Tax=Sphingopyxis sp. TaxID=1908224 RepID=UPI003D6D81A6
MTMRVEIERLRNEHRRLLTLAGHLGRHIAGEFPRDAKAREDFNAVRTRFRTELIAHLKREDWVLYPSLLASGDRQLTDTAQIFIDEMGHIADAFGDYSRRWLPDAIAADWPDYCAATKAILTALAARIEREDMGLYPQALSVDAVDARGGHPGGHVPTGIPAQPPAV